MPTSATYELTEQPDRLIVVIPGLNPNRARNVANAAVSLARKRVPRFSGDTARGMQPLYAKGYFGIMFGAPAWFASHGTRGRQLPMDGKVVPLWVRDDSGELRVKNPKIQTKQGEDGQTRVLIFRRRSPKAVVGANGVKKPTGWFVPERRGTEFLNDSLTTAALAHGLIPQTILVGDTNWRTSAGGFHDQLR